MSSGKMQRLCVQFRKRINVSMFISDQATFKTCMSNKTVDTSLLKLNKDWKRETGSKIYY